jgi:hypothetical protein
MFRRFCKRVLTPPLVILAALFMFVEEWLWVHVTTFTAWVARLPIFRRIEAVLATLPPYGALAILVLPGMLLFPIKFAALYYMAHGHAAAGIGVIIAAKLIGTAVVARMFAVCNKALMQIGWLQRLVNGIVSAKNWLYSRIKAMPAWGYAVQLKNRVREWFARLRKDGIRRRWLAIKRRMRASRRPDSPDLPPGGE